jgi:hypothetical protein
MRRVAEETARLAALADALLVTPRDQQPRSSTKVPGKSHLMLQCGL